MHTRMRFTLPTRRHTLALTAGAAALALAVSTGGAPSAGAAVTTTSTPIGTTTVSGWRLLANDDFTTFNTTRWSVKDNVANSNEESYLLARNVTVANGVLRVQSKKESMGGRKYTSGYVHSRNKQILPNTFRVEVRAKVPLEMGMWAAPMWFRPAAGGGGEIDLLETYGADMQKFGEFRAHHTIHSAYGGSHQTNQKQARIPGDPLGWHTYTIEKTPGRILMFVDGQQKGSWSQGDPTWFNTYYEAGKSWVMIMNLQVGGHRGSPSTSTNWTGDKTAMQIDYVRTWVKG